MKRIIRIGGIIIIIIAVVYFGFTIYGNFFGPEANSGVKMPGESQARYSLVVKNTATVILTNDYDVFGEEVGNRTYILHGYWELAGTKFKYYPDDITLSEQVFGEIVLKIRR